ncbi:MAG: CatA-like O-acetyltransferase [Clostridiales bacterium]|nr:CatA-like O-acetyltransferase [Clostridiales bacterium]
MEAGRWLKQDGRWLLPLSITCHHAAMDGRHVSRFWQSLQQAADSFQNFL